MSEAMDRTFVGMRNALFELWDKLRNGTPDYREVDAAVQLSNSIARSIDMELKVIKAFGQPIEKPKQEEPKPSPKPSLKLGDNPPRKPTIDGAPGPHRKK